MRESYPDEYPDDEVRKFEYVYDSLEDSEVFSDWSIGRSLTGVKATRFNGDYEVKFSIRRGEAIVLFEVPDKNKTLIDCDDVVLNRLISIREELNNRISNKERYYTIGLKQIHRFSHSIRRMIKL